MTVTDHVGNILEIKSPPQRIISLVPSQTELLFDLGLDAQLVGITRYCIHPTGQVETKAKVGGTKRFDFEKIKALQPDLIIGNKEENYKEGIEELQKHYPVWISDIFTLNDAFAMMREVSAITGREKEGAAIITEIETAFSAYRSGLQVNNPTSAAYFIWRKPYMVAAQNTFIDSMLHTLGVHNAFAHLQRYPEITPDILTSAKPDFIFLSTEPYSFSEKHIPEFESISPASKVILVDGEMFSWYGSRLRLAPAYFTQLAATYLT
jgi:ABC-type Fe3+-hydroxamate transport system substrate-binding protein